MSVFTHPITVRFHHCDPAGIVFYPRYFEMFNLVIENWFEAALDHSFKKMHYVSKFGIPTVQIEAQFHAPSFLEDVICFQISVTKMGNSSLALEIEGRCESELRCSVKQTIVCVSTQSHKARPWPDEVRSRLIKFQESTDGNHKT